MIPNARLFMRPVQLHLLSFWRPSSHNLTVKIPVTPHLKSHLIWWSSSANTLKGQSFQFQKMSVVITTDASKKGFGGFMNEQIFQGNWTHAQSKRNINCLEMEAVFLTMKHFLTQIKDQAVLIRSDNPTVVQYINKQGGTKSPQLCYQVWDLWNMAIQNNIQLKAAHIAGKLNILADQLSRTKILPTEWSLNSRVVQNLFQILGQPLIDLFASVHNRQTEIFCSWNPHPEALALDALSISWERMFAYAYPQYA
jgi:ribonuclease HI